MKYEDIETHLLPLSKQELRKLLAKQDQSILIKTIEVALDTITELKYDGTIKDRLRLEKQQHKHFYEEFNYSTGETVYYTIQTREVTKEFEVVSCSKIVRIKSPFKFHWGVNPYTVAKYNPEDGSTKISASKLFSNLGNPHEELKDHSKLEPFDLDLIKFKE